MKSAKMFTYDTLIHHLSVLYGFESGRTQTFVKAVKANHNKRELMQLYHKLITNKKNI